MHRHKLAAARTEVHGKRHDLFVKKVQNHFTCVDACTVCTEWSRMPDRIPRAVRAGRDVHGLTMCCAPKCWRVFMKSPRRHHDILIEPTCV